MVLTETPSQTTMDGTELTLFDVSGLANYSATIDWTVMQAGDTITIRVFVKINGVLTKIATITRSDSQDVALNIPPYQTSEFKITAQQTAGTNRTLDWSRFSQ